jgi:hypothetical protein
MEVLEHFIKEGMGGMESHYKVGKDKLTHRQVEGRQGHLLNQIIDCFADVCTKTKLSVQLSTRVCVCVP